MRVRVVAAQILVIFLAAVWYATPAASQAPCMSYQGELKKNGSLFTGTAQMKFVIMVNGVETAWSNDGSSLFLEEPATSVTIPVMNGLFSLRFGEPPMIPLLTDYLSDGLEPALRIWVNTGDGFEQLPDTPLCSSTFALLSDAAERSLVDFTVGGRLELSPQGLRFDDGTTLTTAPMGGGTDSDWEIGELDIYRMTGNVGIGTRSPVEKLQVEGTVKSQQLEATNWMKLWTNGIETLRIAGHPTTGASIYVGGPSGHVSDPGLLLSGEIPNGGGQVLAYNAAGYPTIEIDGESSGGGFLGMSNGSTLTMQMRGNGNAGGGDLHAYNSSGTMTYRMRGHGNAGGGDLHAYNSSGTMTYRMRGHAYASGSQVELFDSSGNVGVRVTGTAGSIQLFDSSGSNSVWITGQDGGGNGRVRTDVLEITGGADLSERFDITAEEIPIEPGMVVSIDPHNPGRLVVSKEPYQRTVAGIVSGAGGVRSGMVMSHKDTAADGEYPVALTGRVWAWCDASDNAIEPGDLLTTSTTPGHAMKVQDFTRSQGAILGKAMSSLREGRDLVLVLVSLQ